MLSQKSILLVLCILLAAPFVAWAQEEEAAEPEDTRPPLLVAVLDGEADEVESLLSDGADPNQTTEKGMPLLSYAAKEGNQDMVEALLEAGADVDAQDQTGATALMYAAQFDQDDIVTVLLEAGADVSVTDNLGWTPLVRAVIGGNIEAVTALMEAGANPQTTDFFDQSAIDIAESRDLTEILAVLRGEEPAADDEEPADN